MEPESTCPYCHQALAKRPQRKTKCPHCEQPIHVKRPFGAPKGTKALLTAEQAQEEEAKWQASQQLDFWRRIVADAGDLGLFEKHVAAGMAPDLAIEQALNDAMFCGDLQRMKMANGAMATLRRRQDRDPMPYKETVYRLELEQLRGQARGVTVSKPKPGPYGEDRRTGAQCDRFQGRQFTIDEALSEMPLPCGADCICDYRPIFKWE